MKDFQKNRLIQNYPTFTIVVIARKKSNSRNRGEQNQGHFYSAKIESFIFFIQKLRFNVFLRFIRKSNIHNVFFFIIPVYLISNTTKF